MPSQSDDIIIGIDLGTTNSLVAVMDDRGPRVITDDRARALLPSVVRFSANQPLVGHEAREHSIEFPQWTVSSVKRLMGRSVKDASSDLSFLSYKVIAGEHDTARIQLPDHRIISAEEVSAIILRALKDRASRALNRDITKAVITVPAYFDDAQRQATRTAARLAGLNAVRIVNEPTAAALAYGIGIVNKKPETIAVYDLGGGTFDISILKVIPSEPGEESHGVDFFQVLATAGDTHLGGDDVDQLIADLVLREAQQQLGAQLNFTPGTRQELRLLAESTKISLSEKQQAAVRIQIAGASRAFERTFTRAELESLMTPWAKRTIDACERALRDARMKPADIDRVVMVGGSTRIPLIRRLVGEFFRTEPYTALDPDQVVALGAAVQASIMTGKTSSALLLDVVPLSLGIETIGGAVAKLIMRNSALPARAREMFSTSVDGQTSIKLNVVQGEREMVSDCRSLGIFHLRGIPPMPAGIPQLEVEFLVDANGVLNVSAVERRSGKRTAIQIVPSHGLSVDEIERMERESFAHAREDMTRHRIVDLIANCELDLKWIREAISRHIAKLPADQRRSIEAAVGEVAGLVSRARADWQSVDPNEFHRAKESLDRVSIPLHEISITESLKEEAGRARAD